MKAHWYRGVRGRNFGDALTQVLFNELADVDLTWAPPPQAGLFGAGSIAHRIPPGFAGFVFGTGFMFAEQTADLSQARVLALRGPQSARAALLPTQWPGCLYADPGLLAGLLVRKRRRHHRHRLGVVPHYADTTLRLRFQGRPVDVLGGVDRVVHEVQACDRVVTSSLHALILADSLGIESRWEPSPSVLGDGFKFRDYAGAFGEVLVPGTWRLADQRQVAEKRLALLECMRVVADAAR